MNLSEFKELIHKSIQQPLKEAKGKNFNVVETLDPSGTLRSKYDSKASTADGAIEIFNQAEKGNSSAQTYVFLRGGPVIQNVFWKNFLGPNNRVRSAKISDGAWEEWLSICWEEMYGGGTNKKGESTKSIIAGFRPEKAKSESGDSVFGYFGKYLGQYLSGAAVSANFKEKLGGISGVSTITSHDSDETRQKKLDIAPGRYDPKFSDAGIDHDSGDDLGTSGGSGYNDETFEKVLQSDEANQFLDKWKIFSQDEKLQKTGKSGAGPAKVLIEMLNNKQYPDIREKYGLSSGSVNNYISQVRDAMIQYGVDQGWQNAIKEFGADKLISYLSNPSTGKQQQMPDAPKATDAPVLQAASEAPVKNSKDSNQKPNSKNKTFKQKFNDAQNDDEFWKGQQGSNPANVLYTSLLHPRYKIDKIARDEGIPESLAKNYLGRAMKILNRYGIDSDEFYSQVKKNGTKLANMIGSENT